MRMHVVLADANVLYSRCLRDYLLYAAEAGVISVVWSQAILGDVTRRLVANVPGFDLGAAERLLTALAETFPDAVFEPSVADYERLAGLRLRDEDDRQVMAAALAADADVICTTNVKHFPRTDLIRIGLAVLTPDDLFVRLILADASAMVGAHRAAVSNFTTATDQSTMAALRRAQAPKTAGLMSEILGI